MQLGNVQVNFLQAMHSAIQLCQQDADALFSQFGLADLEQSHPDRRISIPHYMRLGHAAIELTGHKELGLIMGQQTQLHHFGSLGFCAQSSATLKDVISVLICYERLFSENSRGHSRIIRADNKTGFQFYSISPYNDYNRFVVDAVIGGWLSFLQNGNGESIKNWSGASIEIEFAQPDYVSSYALWPVPVHFGMKQNILWLPDHIGDKINQFANPVSHQQMKQICLKQLEQITKGRNIQQQVSELIAMHLTGQTPTLEFISAEMQLEPWTLRRKLHKENSSFKALLDDTRKALATRYIRDTHLSNGEISYLMGFSTPAAFQKAFKRWHNLSPGQFRNQHR